MKFFTHTMPAAIMSGLVLLSSLTYAHDTEIYFSRATADNDENQPVANVFVMLDTSGSMRFCASELGGGSGYNATWCTDHQNRRINILQRAMDQLLDSVSPSIRMGIGRFNYIAPDPNSGSGGTGQLGGRVLVPVTELTPEAKQLMRTELAKLNGAGNTTGSGQPANAQPVGDTPTARAFSEAARYMMGMAPVFGTEANGASQFACLASARVCEDVFSSWGSWYRASSCVAVPQRVECRTGSRGRLERRDANLVSSCSDKCTNSAPIISGGRYVSPMNLNNQCETNHIILFTDGAPSSNDTHAVTDVASSNCGSSTSSYNCQIRIATYLNRDDNAKNRRVYTHNIGLYMGTNQANMEKVSEAGGGSTANADSAEELLAAFLRSFELIDEQSRSISAPGVAVNAMNRFQHLDQLYYAVFQPAKSSFWNGNLKRYRLVGGEIHGQSGIATDSETGFFRSDSRSIWSTTTDGTDVTRGGAREHVGTRNLFYSASPGGALAKLNWSSTSIPTNAQLGLASSATPEQRLAVLDGLQTLWGDPLHSAPIMVNYGTSEDNNYVFVSTNGGMLHAINTRTGGEVFAFMPSEFLGRAPEFTTDRLPLNADNTRQTYGLDGNWVAWRRSGATSMSAPEHVYLYGGMRRGGRQYYALDVTNVTAPKMLWQINNTTAGYAGLGQTWSTPTLTQVPGSDGKSIPVLVVGGGYSPDDHDKHKPLSSGDSMGNMVYFINAKTGERIWSAGGRGDAMLQVPEMKWAVPGSVAVVDINFDGVADHMYFGDLGGQVFRVDIKPDGKHQVVRIASVPGPTATPRRFYEAPAVAFVKANGVDELYVAIGSGYRAHPLDEKTPEAIFVIRDDSALNAKSVQLATIANLTNVTAGGLPSVEQRGWYYTFDRAGEKVLASPVIYDGRLLFTTYSPLPDEAQVDPCTVTYGRSFLHSVNLLSARPAALSRELDPPAERSQQLGQSTPPPTPTLIVDEDGRVVVVVGAEPVGEADLGDPRLRKRRWMQLTPDEANSIKGL